MNILIKLMSIVSLVIAPTLAQVHGNGIPKANDEVKIQYKSSTENYKAAEADNKTAVFR